MTIGANIRKLREAAGLTMEQVEEQSGISKSYQSQIETGAHNPGQKTIDKYCIALGVTELEIRFLDLVGLVPLIELNSTNQGKMLLGLLPELSHESIKNVLVSALQEKPVDTPSVISKP